MEPGKKLEAKREEATRLDPGIDQLAKNLAAKSALSQGAAKTLLENWQNVLFLAFLLMLGYLFYDRYQTTVRDRAAEGSQKLENIARQFADFQKILGAEEGKDLPAELRDNTEVVISTQGESFVGRSAVLYRAVAELEAGHPERAEEFIKKGKFKILQGIKAPLPDIEMKKSDLLDELATLIEARRLLAIGGTRAAAIDLLTSLAYGGKFTAIEAIVTLLRVSNLEEREAAITITKQFIVARPDAKEDLINSLREDYFDVSVFEAPKA